MVDGEWVDVWRHPEVESPIIPLEAEVTDEELLSGNARAGFGGKPGRSGRPKKKAVA
jgi:hypothetical protein